MASRQNAGWFQSLWVYVRGNVEAETLKSMIPRVMKEIAPDVPLVIVQTMRERLNDNVYIDRLLTTLSTGSALSRFARASMSPVSTIWTIFSSIVLPIPCSSFALPSSAS